MSVIMIQNPKPAKSQNKVPNSQLNINIVGFLKQLFINLL